MNASVVFFVSVHCPVGALSNQKIGKSGSPMKRWTLYNISEAKEYIPSLIGLLNLLKSHSLCTMPTPYLPLQSRVWNFSCGSGPNSKTPTSSTKMLIVHIVILVLDQTVVSISEVGECLVHLFTIVKVLGLSTLRRMWCRCFRNWKMGVKVRYLVAKWCGGLFFSQVTASENRFPFKMHDSEIVGNQKSLLYETVKKYRTADASCFYPGLFFFCGSSMSCHVMAAFFHFMALGKLKRPCYPILGEKGREGWWTPWSSFFLKSHSFGLLAPHTTYASYEDLLTEARSALHKNFTWIL